MVVWHVVVTDDADFDRVLVDRLFASEDAARRAAAMHHAALVAADTSGLGDTFRVTVYPRHVAAQAPIDVQM